MQPIVLLSSIVLATTIIPAVAGAGFHFLTRYQYSGEMDCDRKGTCHCRYLPEHRLGYAPSNQLTCNTFMDDGYFEYLLTPESWKSYPSICGSKMVDMYTGNGTMEVWEKGANPGKLLAKCRRQDNSKTRCGNGGAPVCLAGYTEVTDVWDCNETSLC